MCFLIRSAIGKEYYVTRGLPRLASWRRGRMASIQTQCLTVNSRANRDNNDGNNMFALALEAECLSVFRLGEHSETEPVV